MSNGVAASGSAASAPNIEDALIPPPSADARNRNSRRVNRDTGEPPVDLLAPPRWGRVGVGVGSLSILSPLPCPSPVQGEGNLLSNGARMNPRQQTNVGFYRPPTFPPLAAPWSPRIPGNN